MFRGNGRRNKKKKKRWVLAAERRHSRPTGQDIRGGGEGQEEAKTLVLTHWRKIFFDHGRGDDNDKRKCVRTWVARANVRVGSAMTVRVR